MSGSVVGGESSDVSSVDPSFKNLSRHVVVASNPVPMLLTCSSLIEVVEFEEKYNMYLNVGGEVPLVHCFSPFILTRLMSIISISTINENNCVHVTANSKLYTLQTSEVFNLLYKLYTPNTAPLAWEVLANVKYKSPDPKNPHKLEEGCVFNYVNLFVSVVSRCPIIGSKDKIINIFYRNFNNSIFTERLRQLGFKELKFTEWSAFIFEEFYNYRKSIADYKAFRPPKNHANHNHHQKSSGTPGVVAATVHNGSGSSLQYPRDLCLGCGHKTTPPHFRKNCPHKSKPGWCAKGIPSAPMVLAALPAASSSSSVAIVQGKVGSSVAPINYNVSIGLDSMSSVSVISPQLCHFLVASDNVSIVHRRSMSVNTAAGGRGNISEFITVYVELPSVQCPIRFQLDFGVLAIPTDMLISWSDIKRLNLWDVLAELAKVEIPSMSTVAPEELLISEGFTDTPFIAAVCEEAASCAESIKTEYKDVFSGVLSESPALLPPMNIELVDTAKLPPPAGPQRQSDVIRKFVADSVNDLLKQGIIVPSTSPVVSRTVVVRAENRDWRMCIDFRPINAITSRNLYPLPNLKGILARLKGYKWYAKVDHKKGYFQLLLNPTCRYLTAFICEAGVFEFTRIPFGLTNAPSYFQYVISTIVLAGFVGVICEAYIDDIVIFANTLDELNSRVRKILERFRQYKLILNPLKFVFGVSEIEFLGHIVSANGISLSPVKRDGLMKIPVPVDRAALRAFLGLANYFREFIPRYAIRTFHMSKLLSPKVEFHWNNVQDNEFVDIKDAVAKAPMLHHINYDLPIIIRSDASNVGVGAVLLQLSGNVEQFVAFASAKFSKAASRWATPDQEAYAFVFAIRNWEHYLRGHKFVVETDHRNLIYVLRSETGRIGRWRLFLQDFDFTVHHIPGVSNVIADSCYSEC